MLSDVAMTTVPMTSVPMTTGGVTTADPQSTTLPAEAAPRLRLAVMRLGRVMRQNAEPTDLTATLVSALSTVERIGPVTLGDLADAEGVQPPSMTRIVAKLQGRGLVTRRRDPHDGRVARLEVTAEGRRLLQRSRTSKNAFLARRLSRMSARDLETLAAALPILERLAGES
jgi:DNA-binding MarR family transcriptional regulator